jgi:hypothetical protein
LDEEVTVYISGDHMPARFQSTVTSLILSFQPFNAGIKSPRGNAAYRDFLLGILTFMNRASYI